MGKGGPREGTHLSISYCLSPPLLPPKFMAFTMLSDLSSSSSLSPQIVPKPVLAVWGQDLPDARGAVWATDEMEPNVWVRGSSCFVLTTSEPSGLPSTEECRRARDSGSECPGLLLEGCLQIRHDFPSIPQMWTSVKVR